MNADLPNVGILEKLETGRTSRRRFLRRATPFFTTLALVACRPSSNSRSRSRLENTSENAQAQAQSLSPTPTCGDSDLNGDFSSGPTPSQTPGPFYSPNSPQRQSLIAADTVGTRLIVTGQVLTTGCVPLANSLIDVWQADDKGRYDNTGTTLRGHQFTDAEGRYWLETIVPGLYPGRTRHLHIKVQAPDRPVLTTQLYLPQEPFNERDFLFQPELLMGIEETAAGKQAQFNFVLDNFR
ncbi:MAG: hypothetical protein ACFB16_18715 [Phormidesmis sp.]